jgi:hypothetical protein
MKTITLIFILLHIVSFNGFSQDLNYDIHGKYLRPLNENKLTNAKSLDNLIDGYPKNWVVEYVSTEILTNINGKNIKEVGENEKLSPAQLNILKKVDIGTDVTINVKYKYENPVTFNIENREMHVVLTVVPENEAKFVGGDSQLKIYLEENKIDKTTTKKPEGFESGIVLFRINKNGDIENAQITKTSGDIETDILLLKVINNMPKWIPAVDKNGQNVKQLFVFSVNKAGC